jgi:hypothetical protein
MGRESRLPLDRLVSIERRTARPAEQEERRGYRVARKWRLVFDEPILDPIPYSILGYHPGHFQISAELEFSEWALGDLRMTLEEDGEERDILVEGLTVLRLDEGHVVMDIDGWLDTLLGDVLDDTWIDGFVAARVHDRLVGVGVSVGRKGRRIFGEFDFEKDEALAHGSAHARAISRHARKWVRPPAGSDRRPWRGLDDG